MLHNSHYWGNATYGKTMSKHEVDPVTGKKIRVVYENPNEPTYIPVPAIVTEDQAKRALEAVSHNKSKSKGNTKEQYLLAHLIYCQECLDAGRGGKMTSHAIRHANRPANTNYRCQFFDKNEGRDRNHVVQAKNVERAVWGDLVKMLQNPDAILATQQQLADAASTQAQSLDKEIATMSKVIAGIENKRSALLDLAGSMDRSRLVVKDNELAQQQQAQEAARAEKMALRDAARSQSLPLEDVRSTMEYYAKNIDALTFEERQELVGLFIKRVNFDNRTYAYTIEGHLPAFAYTSNVSQDSDSQAMQFLTASS